MKDFFKKLIVYLGIITAASSTFGIFGTTSIFAAGGHDPDAFNNNSNSSSCREFLGLTSWDCNTDFDIMDESKLAANAATIAANVLTDATVIASYLVVGFIIYGGFLYMFSSGDATKAAQGKQTLTRAFIGLAITMSAYTIFGAIRVALIGSQNLGECDPLAGGCVSSDANSIITNIIQWIAGVAGAVAAAFIVVGAWTYITSAGDPNKLQKAKNSILYALIGLVIVAAVEIITAFVSNLIREANTSKLDSTTIGININKENYEIN